MLIKAVGELLYDSVSEIHDERHDHVGGHYADFLNEKANLVGGAVRATLIAKLLEKEKDIKKLMGNLKSVTDAKKEVELDLEWAQSRIDGLCTDLTKIVKMIDVKNSR